MQSHQERKTMTNFITPLLFQQIIDRVISKGSFDALAPLVILMLIFTLLETVFSSLRTFQFDSSTIDTNLLLNQFQIRQNRQPPTFFGIFALLSK